MGIMEGFAGTVGGSFFRAPRWVDESKPPGATSQRKSLEANPQWSSLLSGAFLVYSPNLVWLAIAVAVYFLFPYDFDAAKDPTSAEFAAYFWKRTALNGSLVAAFYGFWHVTLYFMWGQRPFVADRKYRVGKVLHNMWYCALGAVQCTAWEMLYIYCLATDRLPFVPDSVSFSSTWGTAVFVLWMFLVPLYREVHFYFAHRLIHVKFLYKYVHSIHHRNTDIEPFAGLSMHPIEHLYYFSSVAHAFVLKATPFAFLWNAQHLLLSPAASHSGYEDCMQSDQYHYLHHRYFECNYGTPTFFFDRTFGTFQDKISDAKGKSASARKDAKATLLGPYKVDQVIFNLFSASCALLVYGALTKQWEAHTIGMGILGISNATFVAAYVSLGPMLVAAALVAATSRAGFAKMFRQPFQKRFGIHI